MQKQYRVTYKMQTRDNPPVTVTYYNGPSLAQALASMVTAAAQDDDTRDPMPASIRPRMLGVSLEVIR